MPLATDNPCPKEPVDISTPGVCFISGWPCNMAPHWRRLNNSSSGKYPFSAKTAYNAGAAWPLDNTKRSRSARCGSDGVTSIVSKYNTVKISVTEREPPGCPDPAFVNIFTILRRTAVARIANSSLVIFFSPLCLPFF